MARNADHAKSKKAHDRDRAWRKPRFRIVETSMEVTAYCLASR